MNKKIEKEIKILNDLLEQDRFYFADIKNKYYSIILIFFSITLVLITIGINPLSLFLLILLLIILIRYIQEIGENQSYHQNTKKAIETRYKELGINYKKLEKEIGVKITR